MSAFPRFKKSVLCPIQYASIQSVRFQSVRFQSVRFRPVWCPLSVRIQSAFYRDEFPLDHEPFCSLYFVYAFCTPFYMLPVWWCPLKVCVRFNKSAWCPYYVRFRKSVWLSPLPLCFLPASLLTFFSSRYCPLRTRFLPLFLLIPTACLHVG